MDGGESEEQGYLLMEDLSDDLLVKSIVEELDICQLEQVPRRIQPHFVTKRLHRRSSTLWRTGLLTGWSNRQS